MDLASVDKLLTTTRSVRKRLNLERPVPPEVIEECLEIAIQAPTGGNTQGCGPPLDSVIRRIIIEGAVRATHIGGFRRRTSCCGSQTSPGCPVDTLADHTGLTVCQPRVSGRSR